EVGPAAGLLAGTVHGKEGERRGDVGEEAADWLCAGVRDHGGRAVREAAMEHRHVGTGAIGAQSGQVGHR
ncbi:hypothetical protein B1218_35370, partial [Pseudomonas ogarae]